MSQQQPNGILESCALGPMALSLLSSALAVAAGFLFGDADLPLPMLPSLQSLHGPDGFEDDDEPAEDLSPEELLLEPKFLDMFCSSLPSDSTSSHGASMPPRSAFFLFGLGAIRSAGVAH